NRTARYGWRWLAADVPACNTSWTSWMGRRSEIFSYRSQMCAWLSTQKALFSSVARRLLTVKTSQKGDSRSQIRTQSRTAPAGKASRSDWTQKPARRYSQFLFAYENHQRLRSCD